MNQDTREPLTAEERIELARDMGRIQAEQNATNVLAKIVAAAGGEVRVPDSLIVSDVSMHVDYINGVTVYRTLDAERAIHDRGADPLPYVPTPADLDDLCAAISATGYASEAVEIVENWTREHWSVESAFTTALGEEPHGQ